MAKFFVNVRRKRWGPESLHLGYVHPIQVGHNFSHASPCSTTYTRCIPSSCKIEMIMLLLFQPRILSRNHHRRWKCMDRVGKYAASRWPHGHGPAAAGATATTVQVASATSRRLIITLKIHATNIPAWSISPVLNRNSHMKATRKTQDIARFADQGPVVFQVP